VRFITEKDLNKSNSFMLYVWNNTSCVAICFKFQIKYTIGYFTILFFEWHTKWYDWEFRQVCKNTNESNNNLSNKEYKWCDDRKNTRIKTRCVTSGLPWRWTKKAPNRIRKNWMRATRPSRNTAWNCSLAWMKWSKTRLLSSQG